MPLQKPARIDTHQHFWQYNAEEYGWISDAMAKLRRDFLPDDLQKELKSTGVDSSITVQARQTVEETRWLLQLAGAHPFIAAVVGWLPLADPGVSGLLEEFTSNAKLRGVRHVIQGEPNDDFILRPDFNHGVEALGRFGLVYDILIYERHLPQAIRFVDRHPRIIFVLDHIAKPRIREKVISPWRENIREMARRENVYCKLSGMVTEADLQNWKESDLKPYLDTVLAAFGPRRLMFGSDWPVCLAAASYKQWFEIVQRRIASLSAAEQDRILGGTAREAYRLK